MRERLESEHLEERELAPFAATSRNSRGRAHSEDEHLFRTLYMRDRDRIVHCGAFRRLMYKTQVFVYHEGDYYRTRLTHSIEVSQISRTIARALRLNEDLCESISLSHDLGHAPFGHSGQDALNELMSSHGGFEHNVHGLRIVDHIENRYPNFRGLNLTWETREAIAKHAKTKGEDSLIEFAAFPNPSVEAQIVDMADAIAYNSHDLDDGLTSNLIHWESLDDLVIWQKAKLSSNSKMDFSNNVFKHHIIGRIIDRQVENLIRQTEENLEKLSINTPDQVRQQAIKVANFSKEFTEERKELSEFLCKTMYKHHKLTRMEEKASNVIVRLFEAYKRRPELLPPTVYKKRDTETIERLICDYIAGMTDRFALEEHQKLFDPMWKI